jgi:acid phosphatase type 7
MKQILYALFGCALLLGGTQGATPVLYLVGAGDIAGCSSNGDEITAKLVSSVLKKHPKATVFTLGDNVYPNGSPEEFKNCYDPSWGAFKAKTRPVVGNHDYHTPRGSGYYAYFGVNAGKPDRGYYSYDLGAWHVAVINSNCFLVGGCQLGSKQQQWLENDLKKSASSCQILMWHHPRFSSGRVHGNNPEMQDIWATAAKAGVELVLNGHEHLFEQFVPMNANGQKAKIGTTEIIVGTGGISLYPFASPQPNSLVRNNTTYGVLQLELSVSSYAWKFILEPGKTFSDSGSEACH